MAIKLSLLSLVFAFSAILLAYPSYGAERGWGVGSWIAKEAGLPRIASILSVFICFYFAYHHVGGWSLVVVPLIGIVAGRLLIDTLRQHVQIVALAGLPLAWILFFVVASTARFADMDCADFSSWHDAQSFYEAEGGPDHDRHNLDADRDGVACESLR